MKKHLVVFEPSGRRGRIEEGKTLLEAAAELGEDIESVCAGRGICGKCIVKIDRPLHDRRGTKTEQRPLSVPSAKERRMLSARGLDESYCLACQAVIRGDVTVTVPEISRRAKHVVRKASISKTVALKPSLRKYFFEIPPGTLSEQRSEAERFLAGLAKGSGLNNLNISYAALHRLAGILDRKNRAVTATVRMGRQVIDIQPGYHGGQYGAALDIGTTTVAAYLCDLESGETLDTEAALNPQIAWGDDVISRINYAMNTRGGLNKLNAEIIACVRGLLSSLAVKHGIAVRNIAELTVVGNTAMHHIFLKLDPGGLASSPFAPVVDSAVRASSRALGLGLSGHSEVYALPVITGFVGADTVSVIIAEEPHRQDKNILIADIGTNGELVLGSRKKLLCASCAMGPALEGGNIRYGMRAAPGAIEKVEIDPVSLEAKFKIVGNSKWNKEDGTIRAKGICGSGIIDALAGMAQAGIIEPSGRFSKNVKSSRLVDSKDGPAFIIARAAESEGKKAITIGIDDVRSFQLAKGAMHAGARILMDRLKIEAPDKIVLAGAFGSYIDRANALAVGLLPDCGLANVYSVGNAAGEGARMALLNTDKRHEAEQVARSVEYVELTSEPSFQRYFIEAMKFPSALTKHGHRFSI